MPHQCVKCGAMYPDGSQDVLKGCLTCKGKFFFYVRKEAIESSKSFISNLTVKDKKQIEEDVYDIMGIIEPEQPVILDIENIRVVKPGQYEISLIDIFKKKPVVYRVGEGKYIIDLVSTFKNLKNN